MHGTTIKTISLSAILILSACSSDESPPQPPIGDISGAWEINEQSFSSNSLCADTIFYVLDVTQNESEVAATGGSNRMYQGTLSGNVLSGTGSFTRAGGITTITSSSAVIADNCSTLTAVSNWTWTNGTDSCSGTTESTGVRTTGNGNCF